MDAATRIRLHTSDACAAAVQVVATLRAAGFGAFLVGGCVRDLVLGLEPKDYDVATGARPDEVKALFHHVVEVGAAFGVVRVRLQPRPKVPFFEVEVATFRADLGYSDGRRPDAVHFTDARNDVQRRDFTLNGLLLDPLDVQGRPEEAECLVIDHVGGLDDLQRRLLRAIGDPAARFGEDALRLLRAPRFAARFGLTVEPDTGRAIRAAAPTLARVSAERISAELLAMLTTATAPRALELLHDLRLSPVLWPRLEAVDPGLRRARSRFAALLAELARPPVTPEPGFAAVTELEPALAVAVLLWPVRAELRPLVLGRDWRLSRPDSLAIGQIWHLAGALHAWVGALGGPVRAALVRLLREPEADAALLLLLAADAAEPDEQRATFARDLRALRALRATSPRSAWCPQPWVTGATLLAAGRTPGPHFRLALAAAEDAQLEGADEAAARAAAFAVLAEVDAAVAAPAIGAAAEPESVAPPVSALVPAPPPLRQPAPARRS